MIKGRYNVINLERQNCLPGSIEGIENDHSMVYDTSRSERNPLTGEQQHPAVYSGELSECWEWVNRELTRS